jgi:hypothetical protein
MNEKMGGSCDNCHHYCCINGESGVVESGECEKCGEYMQLCTNELSEEEIAKRCNGEACGCADKEDAWICEECEE